MGHVAVKTVIECETWPDSLFPINQPQGGHLVLELSPQALTAVLCVVPASEVSLQLGPQREFVLQSFLSGPSILCGGKTTQSY